MQNLFNVDYIGEPPLELPPGWGVLKGKIEKSLNKALDYYHEFPTYTGNTRLVKLAFRLLTWIEDPLPTYIDKVKFERVEIASSVGITNPVNAYSDTTPYFLGEGYSEIMFTDDAWTEPYTAYRNWKDLEPCRFYAHPNTDLSFLLNDGISAQDNEGLALIRIDILLFALQLKGWYDYMQSLPEEQRYDVHRFINSYPVAGTLKSYVNVSIFNMLRQQFAGGVVKSGNDNPFFFLPDTHTITLRYIERLAEILRRKSLSYAECLKAVPMVAGYEDLYEFQRLGSIYRSSKNRWTLNYAKFKFFDFLFRLESTTNYKGNETDRQRIHREFERMRHGRMNANTVTGIEMKAVLEEQNDILKRYL